MCPGRAQLSCARVLSAVALAAFVAQNLWVTAVGADEPNASNPPAGKKRIEPKQSHDATSLATPLRLVDAHGGPVAGAVVAEFFWRDNDRESAFTPTESSDSKTSDARGEVSLKLEIPAHLDGAALYASRQVKGRPLVGMHKVTRDELGKPITIRMYPACRVLFQIDSTELSALEKEYRAELTGPGWWRAAYLRLGGTVQAPRPLFTCSTTGSMEFLVAPGRYTVFAYGSEVKPIELTLEVKPDDRELFLGTLDCAPSDEAKRGLFPGHRRMSLDAKDGDRAFVLRRVHSRALHGDVRGARDVAFSPDGRLVATAHVDDAGLGKVKLWDWVKGSQIATLPAGEKQPGRVMFSRDGKFLVGVGNAPTKPEASSGIVIWDVASRLKARTLDGHTGTILALASSSDGKTLASSGADKTTRLWDMASGRETGRVGDNRIWGRSLAYAPGGQTLAVGNGPTIRLWDVVADRQRATIELEPENFTVNSVAYSADGRTLALAGSTCDPANKSQQAAVWLYDVDQEPPRRRAALTFDRDKDGIANEVPPLCTDVAFTPDGRRVIAVAFMEVRTWHVATATEQDAVKRGGASGSGDRLAVSPDGRWVAITGPFGVGFMEIPPPP